MGREEGVLKAKPKCDPTHAWAAARPQALGLSRCDQSKGPGLIARGGRFFLFKWSKPALIERGFRHPTRLFPTDSCLACLSALHTPAATADPPSIHHNTPRNYRRDRTDRSSFALAGARLSSCRALGYVRSFPRVRSKTRSSVSCLPPVGNARRCDRSTRQRCCVRPHCEHTSIHIHIHMRWGVALICVPIRPRRSRLYLVGDGYCWRSRPRFLLTDPSY